MRGRVVSRFHLQTSVTLWKSINAIGGETDGHGVKKFQVYVETNDRGWGIGEAQAQRLDCAASTVLTHRNLNWRRPKQRAVPSRLLPAKSKQHTHTQTCRYCPLKADVFSVADRLARSMLHTHTERERDTKTPCRVTHKPTAMQGADGGAREQTRTEMRLTVLELEVLDGEVDDRRVFLHVEVVLGEASQVEDQVPAAGSKNGKGRERYITVQYHNETDGPACCGLRSLRKANNQHTDTKDDFVVAEYKTLRTRKGTAGSVGLRERSSPHATLNAWDRGSNRQRQRHHRQHHQTPTAKTSEWFSGSIGGRNTATTRCSWKTQRTHLGNRRST